MFELFGGYDDVGLIEIIVCVFGAMVVYCESGAFVHSYLDDGSAMQFVHYGGYFGWAVLELHVVEGLIGAWFVYCYGGLVLDVCYCVVVGFVFDELCGGDLFGLMVYGDTVFYGQGRDFDVLIVLVMIDIAMQLYWLMGHVINFVLLIEVEWILDVVEIVEVYWIVCEFECEVWCFGLLFDWLWVEWCVVVVVDALCGCAFDFDLLLISCVVFSDPELASVGLMEVEVKVAGLDARVHTVPLGVFGCVGML